MRAPVTAWNFSGYSTQREFLVDLGLLELMEPLAMRQDASSIRRVQALKNLLLPPMMGESVSKCSFNGKGSVPVRCPAFGNRYRRLDREGGTWPPEKPTSAYDFKEIPSVLPWISALILHDCRRQMGSLYGVGSGIEHWCERARHGCADRAFPTRPTFFQKTQAWQKKEKISQKSNRVPSPSPLGKLRRTLKGRACQAPKGPLTQPAVILIRTSRPSRRWPAVTSPRTQPAVILIRTSRPSRRWPAVTSPWTQPTVILIRTSRPSRRWPAMTSRLRPRRRPGMQSRPCPSRPLQRPVRKKPKGPVPEPWSAPLVDALREKFPGQVLDSYKFISQRQLLIRKDRVTEIMEFLRRNEIEPFDFLSDETATHWPKEEEFELVYNLYSFETNDRLRVKARIKEWEQVESLVSILARRQLARTRDLRHVRHPVRKPPEPETNPVA